MSIQHLVDPIRDALAKTEAQIRDIEKDRLASFGVLSQQIRGMMHDQTALRSETGRLASALRTPGIRGQWGELSLRRIAELSGMVEHCDFVEQTQRSNSDRTIRPDMVIRMPDSREMIVDAKAPMDAYLDAVNAENEESRKRHLQRHARHVRDHVKVLAGKRYWEQFEQSPDFVVLFIPGEQFLGAALEQDKTLLDDSLNSKVILATPSTLVALLRAVAFGWKQTVLAENAGKVRELGEELHKRLTVFLDHLERLGRNLGSSVDTYNKALGSLERSVLPGVRKLSELGISSGRNITEPVPVEAIPRRRMSRILRLMLKPIKTRYYLTLLQMLVILFLMGLGILLNKEVVTQFFNTTQAGQLGLVLNGIVLADFLGGLVRMIMIFLGYTREQDVLQRFLKRAQDGAPNPAYGLWIRH